ncbi:MAG: lactate utilization protein [Spirochaetia bacterium]|nr:lactate utilization protein [Spirochaetia bacterium]
MTAKSEYYKICAEQIIPMMEKRQMEAHYFETTAQVLDYLKANIPENSTVSWGGSVTLDQTGILDFLKSGRFQALDRDTAKDRRQMQEIFHQALSADYYFMSSNAITMDGKLVNIDGNGNRVAALIYGPENVIIVAGMNKVVKDEDSAMDRVKNLAAPVNAIRLKQNTLCSQTGSCGHCLNTGCICCQTVITRFSRVPGRIKVLLVGEELGF